MPLRLVHRRHPVRGAGTRRATRRRRATRFRRSPGRVGPRRGRSAATRGRTRRPSRCPCAAPSRGYGRRRRRLRPRRSCARTGRASASRARCAAGAGRGPWDPAGRRTAPVRGPAPARRRTGGGRADVGLQHVEADGRVERHGGAARLGDQLAQSGSGDVAPGGGAGGRPAHRAERERLHGSVGRQAVAVARVSGRQGRGQPFEHHGRRLGHEQPQGVLRQGRREGAFAAGVRFVGPQRAVVQRLVGGRPDVVQGHVPRGAETGRERVEDRGPRTDEPYGPGAGRRGAGADLAPHDERLHRPAGREGAFRCRGLRGVEAGRRPRGRGPRAGRSTRGRRPRLFVARLRPGSPPGSGWVGRRRVTSVAGGRSPIRGAGEARVAPRRYEPSGRGA